ncbi:MAG: hypothetical protein VYB30_00885 [Candidatus Thermoplasmatota archaeon]|nr:hypothetical protein [Candidatus Thermoplasmatota archaeon]
MEHTQAMQIVGAVLVLVGGMKNWDPIGLNKSIFGDVEGIEGGPAASMRMLIGGAFAGIGAMNLYLSMTVDDSTATEAILMGNVIALALIFVTIVAAKIRGFMEEIPMPPMVIFPGLILICLYSAMG